MIPVYIALGVVVLGVIVLVARAMGGKGSQRLEAPPDDFGLRRDPFGKAPPPKPDGPRGSPFDPPISAAHVEEPSDAVRAAVVAILRGGNKIEAIKRFRELTGASLLEAKNQVEAWSTPGAAAAVPPTPARIEPIEEPRLPIEARPALLAEVHALALGDRIAAIKRWRGATGAALGASKKLVEALVAHGPSGVPSDTLLAAWPEGLALPPAASAEPLPFPTGEPSPPPRSRFEPPPIDDLEHARLLAECAAIARGGNKIEAIKKYRDRTGKGLKEAKDAIERSM